MGLRWAAPWLKADDTRGIIHTYSHCCQNSNNWLLCNMLVGTFPWSQPIKPLLLEKVCTLPTPPLENSFFKALKRERAAFGSWLRGLIRSAFVHKGRVPDNRALPAPRPEFPVQEFPSVHTDARSPFNGRSEASPPPENAWSVSKTVLFFQIKCHSGFFSSHWASLLPPTEVPL